MFIIDINILLEVLELKMNMLEHFSSFMVFELENYGERKRINITEQDFSEDNSNLNFFKKNLSMIFFKKNQKNTTL